MKKVVLGCKIAASNKQVLQSKADKLDITLSEYTESLVLNTYEIEEKNETLAAENQALNEALAAANRHIRTIHTSIFGSPKQFSKTQFLTPTNPSNNDEI